MSIEAGWYYADGDPPGTVRRWNGYAWIGVPVRDPNSSVRPQELDEWRPRISRGGALLGVVTLLVISGLAALFALVASRIFRDLDEIPVAEVIDTSDTVTDASEVPAVPDIAEEELILVSEIPDYIEGLGGLSALLLAGVAVTAIIFPLWLRSAAKAAQVRRYRRSTARKQRQKPSAMVVAVQVFIFGLFVPIWWGLQAIVDEAADGGNKNLFGAVSDTAAAASRGLGPGQKDISPIKIIIWWAMWLLPTVVLVGAWGWMFFTNPVPAATLRGIMQLTGVMLVLLVISLLCLLVTVGQVNGRLSRPSHMHADALPRRF